MAAMAAMTATAVVRTAPAPCRRRVTCCSQQPERPAAPAAVAHIDRRSVVLNLAAMAVFAPAAAAAEKFAKKEKDEDEGSDFISRRKALNKRKAKLQEEVEKMKAKGEATEEK
eukprot:jgi/Chlat1/6799/Chrsp51S06495